MVIEAPPIRDIAPIAPAPDVFTLTLVAVSVAAAPYSCETYKAWALALFVVTEPSVSVATPARLSTPTP
ncbi:hypothetical protein D3C71_1691250 [compost metagenome]